MNPPQVYMCSPFCTLLPPPSPYHPSGSSQCTSPKHPVSCIEPGLATHFIHDILHVSMPFSQIFPPSPSFTESIRLFYTSVSLLLSRTQGYCYHLSNFLKEISSLSHSIIFLFFFFLLWSLRKAFLSLLAILWNSDFRWLYLSFSLFPLASLLFSAICKASSDSHFAFFSWIYMYE